MFTLTLKHIAMEPSFEYDTVADAVRYALIYIARGVDVEIVSNLTGEVILYRDCGDTYVIHNLCIVG